MHAYSNHVLSYTEVLGTGPMTVAPTAMEAVPARHEGDRDVKGYTISHAYIYVLTAYDELIHYCVRILLCFIYGGSIIR